MIFKFLYGISYNTINTYVYFHIKNIWNKIIKVRKRRECKSKNNINTDTNVIIESNNTPVVQEEKVAKKRGRKPKGGKIITQQLNDNNNDHELATENEKFTNLINKQCLEFSKSEYEKKISQITNTDIAIKYSDIINKINVCFWFEELFNIKRFDVKKTVILNLYKINFSLQNITEEFQIDLINIFTLKNFSSFMFSKYYFCNY